MYFILGFIPAQGEPSESGFKDICLATPTTASFTKTSVGSW